MAATPRRRGTSRILDFATTVSVRASAAAKHGEPDRKESELPPGALRVRKEHLCGEHEHEPVPHRGAPLEERQVASAVLEHGAFVDHRELEVRVRVVDRLAPCLRDDDECKGGGAQRERRARPGVSPGGAGDDTTEVGRSGHERRDREREHQRRLHEHGEREVSARSLQGEAVGFVPGGGRDGEAGERQQSREREGVVPEAPAGRLVGRRHEQDRRRQRGGHDERCEPVDDRRPLDVDRALSPQPAQFAVRLQRRWPAASLEPRFQVLDETGEKRREHHPTDDLRRPCGDGGAAHPTIPIRTETRRARTSAIR